jgi:hypothetical protein
MAFKQDPNYKYEIKEVIGVASPQEDLKGNWVKAVIKSLMTTSDGTDEGVDIRKYNVASEICGHGGIRLSIEEAHNVCNILLQAGYGSTSILEEECKRRKQLYEENE